MNSKRVFCLNNKEYSYGCVLYLMSRDQRLSDNWALLAAQEYAFSQQSDFAIAFCLNQIFLNASDEHFAFMVEGIRQIANDIRIFNIPFYVLSGDTSKVIPDFVRQNNISALFFDFDPLKIKKKWQKDILHQINIPAFEVDAHNIIPCRLCSDKQEFAAYTIRPKITKKLPEFLTDFPNIKYHKNNKSELLSLSENISSDNLKKFISTLNSVPNKFFTPGAKSAKQTLDNFIKNRLNTYDTNRNKPELNSLSGLSPYLHFGQISAQRVATEIMQSDASESAKSAFLDELIVRRELADNFCFYNDNYDNFDGFPIWAKTTLNKHLNDKREYIYSLEELENHTTHDNLWNYAQKSMQSSGKMHSYLRMYWAKKILEWTTSPETAIQYAIYLNDKYEFDGRDPNGYAGIAWSIGGVHDRAWNERPIFGKIRFMSYNSQIKKINLKAIIN